MPASTARAQHAVTICRFATICSKTSADCEAETVEESGDNPPGVSCCLARDRSRTRALAQQPGDRPVRKMNAQYVLHGCTPARCPYRPGIHAREEAESSSAANFPLVGPSVPASAAPEDAWRPRRSQKPIPPAGATAPASLRVRPQVAASVPRPAIISQAMPRRPRRRRTPDIPRVPTVPPPCFVDAADKAAKAEFPVAQWLADKAAAADRKSRSRHPDRICVRQIAPTGAGSRETAARASSMAGNIGRATPAGYSSSCTAPRASP